MNQLEQQGDAMILARHWREARAMSRFDARRFDGLAKLVVSVERRAMQRRLAFMEWASEQWPGALRSAPAREARAA